MCSWSFIKWNGILATSSQKVTHFYDLISRPIERPLLFVQDQQPQSLQCCFHFHNFFHLLLKTFLLLFLILHFHKGFPVVKKLLSMLALSQDPLVLLVTKHQSLHWVLLDLLNLHLIRKPEDLDLPTIDPYLYP